MTLKRKLCEVGLSHRVLLHHKVPGSFQPRRLGEGAVDGPSKEQSLIICGWS